MKAEIKQAWVAALRSRRFFRTTGTLKTVRNESDHRCYYCCLGVLCKVAGLGMDEDSNFLTPAQLRRVGLTETQQVILANMNDGRPADGVDGLSFRKIADYIEKTL